MNKKVMLLLAAVCTTVAIGMGSVGCNRGNPDSSKDSPNSSSETSSPAEEAAPVLKISGAEMTVPAGKKFTFPTATATDEKDGNLTEAIRVCVVDRETGDSVYPLDENETILLKEAEWTPGKAGEYKVNYSVVNAAGKSAEAYLGVNALSAEKNAVSAKEDWLARNARFDEDGYLEIGRPKSGETTSSLPGAAYAGRKIKSGDIVTVRFNSAYLDGGVARWYMAFGLTSGYAAETPSVTEDTASPFILEIRQNKLYVRNGKEVTEFTESLLDGEDHTLSAKFDVSAAKVTYSLWIDTDTSKPASGAAFAYKEKMDESGTPYDPNLFDPEKFGGYFTMIGSRADTSKAEDTMRIQAFTVNGEAQLEKPVLKVEEPEYAWYLNEDCVFPAATAKDGTFGTDLSEKVEVFVVDSEGNAEKVTGDYRFAEAGLYRLKYRVSDEYGNITVKSFAISCAPAKTTENPVLTVSGYDDGAELTAEAMSEFTLPAVAECKDSNGEDISQRLSVAVTGPVTASLEDGGKFIPYAAGEYAIVYSVSDYTGKETTLTLKLSVTAPADCAGNQVVKNPDAFAVNNSEVRGGGIYLNSSGSFTYTGQMIYEEKVSMLLDWTIASSHEISDLGGVWDGAYLTMINMRGGASLNKVPSATSEWPTGFIILIDPYDHLTIQPAGHQTGILARLKFDNLREAFYGKEVLLQYQITDIVNEDGSLDRYCIQLWINGVRVGSAELPWTYTSWADSEGNFVIRARQASVYQNLAKAGWLNVTTYCGDDKTGRPNIVKWLSVDGVYVDSKLNVSGEIKEISVTETYTLPTVELLFDGVAMPLKKTLYIGASETGRALADDTTEFIVESEYLEGFRIEYSYDGVIYYTIEVTVNGAVEEIVWTAEKEGLVTKTAHAFPLPAVSSAKILGETVTEGYTYDVAYASGYTEKGLTAEKLAAYSPILPADYTVTAYNRGQKIGSYAVTNTSGVGDIAGESFTDGDKFKVFYTGELLWENTVTMNITLTKTFDVLFLPVRGSVAHIESVSDYATWLGGVCFRFYNGQIQLLQEIDKTAYATYELPASFTALGDHVICYSVVNNKNADGEIISITVALWLDGQLMTSLAGNTSTTIAVSNIESSGGLQPAPLWGKQYDYITLNSLYLDDADGTKVAPAYRSDTDYTKTLETVTDVAFELPLIRKITGKAAAAAEISLDGTPLTSNIYTFTEGGTYTFLYTFEKGDTIEVTVRVTQISEEPVFSFTGQDGAETTVERAINTAIDIPFSYGYGETDLTEKVTVHAIYGNYVKTLAYAEYTAFKNNVREDFVLKYMYMDQLLAEKNVKVTGKATGNVVTDATNKTGGTEADGVWSGTLSPAYLAEHMHDYTASIKFRLDTFGYVAIGLRGEAALNPTYGYDWPQNSRFALDNGRLWLYIKGDAPIASSDISRIWNDSLVGTDVIFTVKVNDEFDENGAFVGTAVQFYINGTLLQLDDVGLHKGNTLADGNTMYIAATRSDVNWEVWNAPLNFGMFRTSAVWTIKEVYFDGTIAGTAQG